MRINWHPYKISSHGCQTNKQHAMSTHRGIIARQDIVIVTEETEFIHANLSTIGSCISFNIQSVRRRSAINNGYKQVSVVLCTENIQVLLFRGTLDHLAASMIGH